MQGELRDGGGRDLKVLIAEASRGPKGRRKMVEGRRRSRSDSKGAVLEEPV